MPPKRVLDSEENSAEDLDTSSASSNTSGTAKSRSATATAHPDALLVNNPNDEKHTVDDARDVKTPAGHDAPHSRRLGDYSHPQEQPQTQKQTQPQATSSRPEIIRSPLQLPVKQRVGSEVEILHNKPNDECVPVTDAHQVQTPRTMSQKVPSPSGEARGVIMRNAPHDEAIAVSSSGTPVGTPGLQRSMNRMKLHEESTDEDEEKEEDDEQESRNRGFSSQRPDAIVNEPVATVIPNLEYKPHEYAKINATASMEMQELFKRIIEYQPSIPDIPAKLRPFIPDYIPSVGDLDPFCKVPRPDGRPDGLGIYVLDEPSVTQSNPAVVLLELRATNIHSTGGLAEVVDSFEDAANRPEVIDRWIADVKKVHYKKPLPTINYQKPMPEIETLLQVWPQGFEDFLNSDVQFPPPHIDMDLDQYVRTLAAILDIPTYTSLIDSLHVMFTLYQEFRANQHFQHE